MDAPLALDLKSPWLNAAGFQGFSQHRGWPVELQQGVFITSPISLKPRHPAANRVCLPFNGGFLLHTGWPNPGLKAVLRAQAAAWARSTVPVWVHLLANDASELQSMIRTLENVEGVMAVELGLKEGISEDKMHDLVSAGMGELPLIVEVAMNEVQAGWVGKAAEWGVSAVSLGAPRGCLTHEGKLIEGRIYGPCVLPLAWKALQQLENSGIPVIAGGGIYRKAEGEALLVNGAAAVKLDAVLWRGIWS